MMLALFTSSPIAYSRPTVQPLQSASSKRTSPAPLLERWEENTHRVRIFRSVAKPSGSTRNRAPSEYHLNLGRLVDTMAVDHPALFDRPQDLSLFADTVELRGPDGNARTHGLGQYTALFDLLRFVRRVAMDDATLTHRIVIEDRSVRLRWSAKLHMKDPTFGLTSFGGEPVVVHVDGVSVYDLDGRGHVHVHRLENVVMSGRDRDALLNYPNLELMWRLPALVPPAMPVPAGAGGRLSLGAPAQAAATALRRAVARTKGAHRGGAPRMVLAGDDGAEGETPMERAARERAEDAAEAARLKALLSLRGSPNVRL
jgi:hypothetical protein